MTRIEEARALVGGAERIVVLTGAGISADSGVPTFRGEEGLWGSYRPEQLATPEAFRADPALVWSWYAWRRGRIAECLPNAAHRALARLALQRENVTIVTQNVDGLHGTAAREEAGTLSLPPDAALPVELHGCIFRLRCSHCSYREAERKPDPGEEDHVPECRECGERLRPDVVWFGEPLPRVALTTAFERAETADLCLVVGTSALVHPAASVPLAAARGGARIVEVNPDSTPLSPRATVSLQGSAASVVPELVTR